MPKNDHRLDTIYNVGFDKGYEAGQRATAAEICRALRELSKKYEERLL